MFAGLGLPCPRATLTIGVPGHSRGLTQGRTQKCPHSGPAPGRFAWTGTCRAGKSELRPETAIRLGHALRRAKDRVGHGQFEPWLSAHTDGIFSTRSAGLQAIGDTGVQHRSWDGGCAGSTTLGQADRQATAAEAPPTDRANGSDGEGAAKSRDGLWSRRHRGTQAGGQPGTNGTEVGGPSSGAPRPDRLITSTVGRTPARE